MSPDPKIDAAILRRIQEFREDQENVPGNWQAKRELSGALRALLDCLCATDASEEALREAAGEVRAMAARFAAAPTMAKPPGIAEMGFAGMETFHDRSPMVGQSNPLAPPLVFTVDREAGVVRGTGRFGNAYEGAPGCVHGGFVSAAFDELLGMACIFSGKPGMTGTLEVRYRKPTPVRSELRFEGRFDRCEGRKIYTEATLHAGEVLCAEATGLFISIDRAKFEELDRVRQERARDDSSLR